MNEKIDSLDIIFYTVITALFASRFFNLHIYIQYVFTIISIILGVIICFKCKKQNDVTKFKLTCLILSICILRLIFNVITQFI